MYEALKLLFMIAFVWMGSIWLAEWLVYRPDRKAFPKIKEGQRYTYGGGTWQVMATDKRTSKVAVQLVEHSGRDIPHGGVILCGAEFLLTEYHQVTP